jgi:protein phosphatase 1H
LVIQVRIVDIEKEAIYDTDVLVMGTDGLWDVTSNERVAESVQRSLEQFPAEDAARYRYRFTSAAQDLVMCSRGKLNERSWRTADSKSATIDDISVFVIPLAAYKEEHLRWKQETESQSHRQSDHQVSVDIAVNDPSTVVESAVMAANQPGRMTADIHTNGIPPVDKAATLLDPEEKAGVVAVVVAEEDKDATVGDVAAPPEVIVDPLQPVTDGTSDPEIEDKNESNS